MTLTAHEPEENKLQFLWAVQATSLRLGSCALYIKQFPQLFQRILLSCKLANW